MQDITEALKQNEDAVKNLGGEITGRMLEFRFIDPETGILTQVEYYQDTLGLMPMQDLFNKVRAVIQEFIEGDTGIKLGELMRGDSDLQEMTDSLRDASAERQGEVLDKTLDENRALVKGLLKLVEIVPALELDIFAASLGVPYRRVEWFKDAISEPPHRGGLRVGEGFDIMRHFIRQNAAEIKAFFTEEATSLAEEFQLAMGWDEENESSETSTGGKPSSTSVLDIPVNE